MSVRERLKWFFWEHPKRWWLCRKHKLSKEESATWDRYFQDASQDEGHINLQVVEYDPPPQGFGPAAHKKEPPEEKSQDSA